MSAPPKTFNVLIVDDSPKNIQFAVNILREVRISDGVCPQQQNDP